MVDWLLDRLRTAVNRFGDSVGAAIVDGVVPQDDEVAKGEIGEETASA